ncbi:hypothetical protein J1N35_028275 [Gossypium stocksii]|uniref:Disease resistance protein At4g27190-like leucine-rich repeats domain-containing protein n=1 Tax=Gossypium stocksii TaxID=47602 RepID=A0A9D3UVV3_9ROSI|nr:hypothetical protein J1N35_028275 [Gossypium stocksii]
MKSHYPLFWPKLKTVDIRKCENLRYLYSSTWAQGHPCLESINIEDCPRLIQVINVEKNKDGFGLQESVLSDVGNSHQLCNIDAPILNEDCIVVENHEEVFQVQGGYSFSSIKKLYLTNLFEVRIIWNDFAQVVTLENLTTLKLSDCKKLRYIFSPTTARSLSHLVDLCIEGCDEIERLILTKDQVSSSSSNGDTGLQPISFPNLTEIAVTNCENLKCLFPFGSVPVLPKLESLIVKGNSKLEQVFELEDEVEMATEMEMKFDKLEWLSLEELPSLIHFSPKEYHFVLSELVELKVRDCPKLTTGFFIDSQKSVHCKTKTPQLVDQDVIEEFATVRNSNFNEDIDWNQWWGGSQLPHVT